MWSSFAITVAIVAVMSGVIRQVAKAFLDVAPTVVVDGLDVVNPDMCLEIAVLTTTTV